MTPNRPPVPISLDAIDVASPCTQPWDAMTGDDRSRFCESCRLHVYDLSAMTRDAAEEFVRTRKQGGGSVCVRLVRRADGTVVTDDCGPVRRALRRRALRVRAAAVAALAFIFPMAACGREPPAPAPAAAKPRDVKPPVAPAKSDPTPPAPPAPATAPPDAVAPPSPSPPAPPEPPSPPEPKRTESVGKI